MADGENDGEGAQVLEESARQAGEAVGETVSATTAEIGRQADDAITAANQRADEAERTAEHIADAATAGERNRSIADLHSRMEGIEQWQRQQGEHNLRTMAAFEQMQASMTTLTDTLAASQRPSILPEPSPQAPAEPPAPTTENPVKSEPTADVPPKAKRQRLIF